MGSKLSIFRKTVENVEKELSEGLNNLKVSESAQPSEPTPINADIKTEKVEEKCNCVDCKCDPCNCHLKDLPLLEPITETKVVAELNTQSLNEEQSIPSAESTKDEVITNENKPSEESPKEVKPEQTVESTPEETKVEETPKDNNEEKKCLCDPCECNPCNCCSQEVKQESDTSPQNDSQKQEESQPKQTEQPSADTQEVGEKLVNQEMEPQNDSPVEEQPKESENHEKTEKPNEETNKESDAQPVHQINDNVETPQESSQALEVQQN